MSSEKDPFTEPNPAQTPSNPEIVQGNQERNEMLLAKSEMGVILTDAYRSAVELDPRMADIAIVPIEDPNDPRHGYASSKESKSNVTGQHEVHIRLDNLDTVLAKYEQAMSDAPEAIGIIAGQLGVSAEEVTPQTLYVQSILHEMGHLTEHMDAEEVGEPRLPIERRKREMNAMPLGGLAVSRLAKADSAESEWFDANWQKQAERHGVTTREELIAIQSAAYRGLTSETIADNFAADVFLVNPQLLSQMQHGSLDSYRDTNTILGQLNANRAAARTGEAMERQTSALGETTQPEVRRYTSSEQYRFLTHATLDNPERTLAYLANGSAFTIDSDKPLNTSLVDQNHTATFEGSSGFIIQPPEKAEDITGVWSGDVGVDLQAEGQHMMSADEVLAATKAGEYNQLHIKTGKVEGVFIRVAADTGQELGSVQTNQALRELAEEHKLPIAEIAVEPREINEGPPVLDGPHNTGSGDLYQIVVPMNGHEYKIDIIRQAQGSDVSFVDADGFAMRMAKVDGYDVWDRSLKPEDLDIIKNGIKKLPLAYNIRQYLDKEIAKVQDSTL